MKVSPQAMVIDIGDGTQDVLLYQRGREEGNNPQLILPAPGGSMMMTGPWGLVKAARISRLLHGEEDK